MGKSLGLTETMKIPALLIDRSLGNLGLRRNKYFVICIEPKQISHNG
jgi:hypothetical protein